RLEWRLPETEWATSVSRQRWMDSILALDLNRQCRHLRSIGSATAPSTDWPPSSIGRRGWSHHANAVRPRVPRRKQGWASRLAAGLQITLGDPANWSIVRPA